MSAYRIKLIKKEVIARETMAFHFEKPAGFTYRAGQYGDFGLINPPETDNEGDRRNFSLASAPSEPELVIATRMRNTAFKRVLKELPEGGELELGGPYGSFDLPKDPSTPAVFLTGGIGATFVRSILTQATHDHLSQKITFFYSNRSLHDAAFMAEFTALTSQNENFTFIPTLTESDSQSWTGQQGYITVDLLRKYIDDLTTPIYYLSGSAAMIGAMRKLLISAGVNRFHIRSDQFIGY